MYSQKHPEGIQLKERAEAVEISYQKVETENITIKEKQKENDR